ncbi:hypothetical protein GCM10007291_41650 [Gemmobacter nanjingensis]|uniref:Uncharacterized protein n=1 Tax=Gemmobacter nanjingensis TaxID=488454 RepID=A0ABQ3FSX6_9RHOB|nr:hypothetical protein [Gemmobacter nanjingensis]GHC35936.1 hypothetical protein GCM10007291_41650 [Gemmobacter nanjingensis]
MSSLISHVSVKDGRRILGWCFDPLASGQPRKLQVVAKDGKSIPVEAKEKLPEWALRSIRAAHPEISMESLASAVGFFQITLGSDVIQDYSEVSVKDIKYGRDLNGSPLVVKNKLVRGSPVKTSRYISLDDKDLQDLSFRSFVELVRNRQAAGQIVLALPPFISWNIPLFQRPQHMASAIAKAGGLFIYFSDCYQDTNREIVFDGENLIIVALDRDFFERFLIEVNNVHYILYSTSPQDLIQKFQETGQRLIYEYVDHIDPKISAGWTEGCVRNWRSLSDSNTHAIVATAKLLHEEVLTRFEEDRVALIPNGVNRSHFQHARDRQTIPPSFREIIDRNRPIVGYYGAIAPWIDYELIAQLAAVCPEIDFVYIGPLYLKEQADLPVAPNIFWYGAVDYFDLPHYAVWFDLSFIPFEKGDIASTTSPLKLFEYFELAKPVVVTSWMLECIQFPIVRHGRTAEEIAVHIHEALDGWTEADTAASRALAAEHDWLRRAEDFVDFLKRLDSPRPMAGTPVHVEDIFVASSSRNLRKGGLSYEVIDDQITLFPNTVSTASGSVLNWRLQVPRSAFGAENAVLEFDFGFAISGNDNVVSIDLLSGDEGFRFSTTAHGAGSSDMRRVRLPIAAACNEIALRIQSYNDLQLNSNNTAFRFSNFHWLNADAQIYCNATPVERNGHRPKIAPPQAQSILTSARLQRLAGPVEKIEQFSPSSFNLPDGPVALVLPDRPETGDMVEMLIEPTSELVAVDRLMRLKLCSPHYNPGTSGRVIYYVACEEDVVYFEDVCLFAGLNELIVPATGQIRIGLLCIDNDAGWQWRDLSSVELFDIELLPPDGAVQPGASSPAGTAIFAAPQGLEAFRIARLTRS